MRDFIAMLEERREQQASNGGQLKPLIMNDDGEPPMMSDEKAHLFLRGYGFGTAYPFQYTGAGGDRGLDLWSNAAFHGRVDVCAWLKAKGAGGSMNTPCSNGITPLMRAMIGSYGMGPVREEACARWMVANGADVKAIDNRGVTTFSVAAGEMSFAFVRELAGKVPPEHLALPDFGRSVGGTMDAPFPIMSPMGAAFEYNTAHRVRIVKFLILRGAPVRFQDFPPTDHDAINQRRQHHRRQLVDWAKAELANHRTFVALVLGCGVHGCRDVQPAQRSKLLKLRGDGNTDARMRIAKCLGVRTGSELGHLRRAVAVWGAQS